MTWNIEGLKANIFVLSEILLTSLPDLVFLSEPQIYLTDIQEQLSYVEHEYCYWLNSADLLDPELPQTKSRATGGTLALWRKCLDPYVSVHPCQSSSFLPIILKLPGSKTSIHVALYFPTHGKDAEFISEMANLKNCLDDLACLYHDPVIYIRGDGNSNPRNEKRYQLLQHFINRSSLKQVEITHPTYHHFVGHGQFDSNIDILLHSAGYSVTEIVTDILCKHEYPEISSHHDVIFSQFSLPPQDPAPKSSCLITAPRISQTREKVLWTPEGAKLFQELVSPQLKSLRQSWLNPLSKASTSVLLQTTNEILALAAKTANKTSPLGDKNPNKARKIPRQVLRAQRHLTRVNRKHRLLTNSSPPTAKGGLGAAKKRYRQAVRTARLKESIKRDSKLDTILTDKPSNIYSYLRSIRKTKAANIEKLTVGDKVYEGSAVADGFFDSMTALKSCDYDELQDDPHLAEHLSNYEHILKICKDHHNIPQISKIKAADILTRMKSHVIDFYSITSLHYINAGEEGLLHFCSLLNSIIKDVNNATLEEFNLALGLILYKGHRKEKTSDRSYRTISTCPFLAKALDLYLRDLYHELWDNCTAPTQYQAPGSSHELASLLVTEVAQFSLYVSNKPVYFLFLDAQSAFDRCLKQILCCELFKAGINGSALTLINNRLSSRSTVYQWEGEMLGPAPDQTGFEQGGINSGDYYKLYNNIQLKTAQSSGLGVNIGSSTVSAIGLADDVCLASDDIDNLRLLATLTETYCANYRVKLVPSKTKLLPVSTPRHQYLVNYAELVNPVTIGGVPVGFVPEAEHVGVVRSTAGNLPNILQCISSYKKALASVSSAGLARGHRGNPAASLRVHTLYAAPKLFSGLASLVLSKFEVKLIETQFKATLQNLQRLHQNTPRAVVYFLAGSLPAEAILHSKQLSLFSMICHLPTDPLHDHAKYILSGQLSSKSWFLQIRDICCQYNLPNPLQLLDNPPSKEKFKKEVKFKILDYWQHLLRAEAQPLPSIQHFKSQYYSLSKPHHIWTSSASNPFECSKSTILARMISGRYRTEALCRHWSDNRNGYCKAPSCYKVNGDLEHLLTACPSLEPVRARLHQMWRDRTVHHPSLRQVVEQVLSSPASVQVQFILEPMAFPYIVSLFQLYGHPIIQHVFYLTRTFAFYIHRENQILLEIWPGKIKSRTVKKQANTNKKSNLTNKSYFPGISDHSDGLPSPHTDADARTTTRSAASSSNHLSQQPDFSPSGATHIASQSLCANNFHDGLGTSTNNDLDHPSHYRYSNICVAQASDSAKQYQLSSYQPIGPVDQLGPVCYGGVVGVGAVSHLVDTVATIT